MKVRVINKNGVVKIVRVLADGKEQVLFEDLKDGQAYEIDLSLKVKEGLVEL